MPKVDKRQADVEIAHDVSRFLGWWEGSASLAGESAENLVSFILRHDRLQEAIGEIDKFPRKFLTIDSLTENLANRDP